MHPICKKYKGYNICGFPPPTSGGVGVLQILGILENINQPVLLINGKHDYISPVGNIYFMLEHGPATGKEARVYSDAGHCAFKYFNHWAPESFQWLKEKLCK